MSIFRSCALGLALGAGATLVVSASEAKVPVAPMKSETTITKVAEGCGPGGWRGPGGACHYGSDDAGAVPTVDCTAGSSHHSHGS